MLLLISPWWLTLAFVGGSIATILTLAIFGARDVDLPKQTGKREEPVIQLDPTEKFYHSQPIKYKGVIKN